MWPWRSSEKRASTEDDRLATLSRRLDDAESKIRMLTGEWQDTLDRMERILGRLNKRAARAEAPAPEPEPVNGHDHSEAERIVALRRSRVARPGGG